MRGRPIKGLLLGCGLGLLLWIIACLVVFAKVGYLPHTRIYLWWLLGVIGAFAGVEVMRTLLRRDPEIPYPRSTPSPS